MKVQIEGKIINSSATKKGGCIASILSNPDARGGQEVYKAWFDKPQSIGAAFKGVLEAEVEMWFAKGA